MKTRPQTHWHKLDDLHPLIAGIDDEGVLVAASEMVSERLRTVQAKKIEENAPKPKRAYTRKSAAATSPPAPPAAPQPAGAPDGADDPIKGPWRTAKEHMLIIARSGVAQVSKSAFESGIAKWVVGLGKVKAEDSIPPADRLAVARAMADDRFDYANGRIMEGAVT